MGNALCPGAPADAPAAGGAARAAPASARPQTGSMRGGSMRGAKEAPSRAKPVCATCKKEVEYKWGDMQPNQRRHWVWMAEEQQFVCRACFRELQEQRKKEQEERDKLKLAKLMKFGEKTSKPPALRRIDSGREWHRTPSFQTALSLTEATEVKLLVWEMARQDRTARDSLDGVRPGSALGGAPPLSPPAAASPSGGSNAAPPRDSPGGAGGAPDAPPPPPLPSFPKSAEQRARLGTTLQRVALLRQLAPAQSAAVVDALFERRCKAGDTIIRQGDEADNFYVVESGEYDVFVSKAPSGPNKLVMSYGPGGTFGELALLHGAPRAATVVAKADGLLWALGRDAFLRVLVDVTWSQRRKYEAFLAGVPLLAGLEPYERSALADCLLEMQHQDGDAIIRQGDAGDAFYLLLEGEAAAVIADASEPGGVKEVMRYGAGQYFGEIALLRDEPRKATVLARGAARVARLERDAFRRLLANPLKAALDQKLASYARPHDEKFVG